MSRLDIHSLDISPLEQVCIEETKKWITSFVIKLNLCPFAKHVMDNGSVRIQVRASETTEQALFALTEEVQYLNANPDVATTLVIFPLMLHDFFEYLDFVDQVYTDVLDEKYEGIYQLATFHPDYCFADTMVSDVTNYTNRSPYPMLHLLREEELATAIAYYGDTEKIPENNMTCLRQLGLDAVKKML